VKLYSKEKALEILAKYTTLYSDAPQTVIPSAITIQVIGVKSNNEN
jgi:hypothetical protein